MDVECGFNLCVYEKDRKCTLDVIELGDNGICSCGIIVDIKTSYYGRVYERSL